MRVLMVTLTAMTLLLVTGRAEAGRLGEGEPKGDEFVRHKNPKFDANDYYVVPTGQSNQCSIVAGEWENKPAGALGGAPYASANYAKAALKTFPECKGGRRTRRRTKNMEKNRRERGVGFGRRSLFRY